MTIRQLRYLASVAECGSLTDASRQLNVSQPSITKAITSLEEEYHIRLFERRSRGIELTEEGREFMHYVRSVLSSMDTLEACAGGILPGKKRLSVVTQQLDFIYPLVEDCYKQTPEGELYYNIAEADRAEIIRQTLSGEADIGLIVHSADDPKDFLFSMDARRIEAFELDKGCVYVAVGQGCPLWSRESVQMEDVLQFTQVALDMESSAKEAFWSDQKRYRFFNARRMIFCNSARACEYFLKRTDSVCFVSPWTHGCFQDPTIRILPVENTEGQNRLLWLRRAGEPLSRTERQFISGIYRSLGKADPTEIPEPVRVGSSDKTGG